MDLSRWGFRATQRWTSHHVRQGDVRGLLHELLLLHIHAGRLHSRMGCRWMTALELEAVCHEAEKYSPMSPKIASEVLSIPQSEHAHTWWVIIRCWGTYLSGESRLQLSKRFCASPSPTAVFPVRRAVVRRQAIYIDASNPVPKLHQLTPTPDQ